MSWTPPMPGASAVGELLEQLLGVEIGATQGPPTDLEDPYAIAVAEYVDDEGAPVATWICDRAFIAYTGGAIAMMSKDVIREALEAPTIPSSLAENVAEILNIGSRLFIDRGFRHMRLSDVHWGPGAVPPGLRAMIAEPSGRDDVWVDIEGYGSGRCILMTGAAAVPEPDPETV